ncbi:core-2/I-Branching enzyme domain-containing protein [Ditylenchus destructor]|nr:core-2/I-Branching enzyme domain-containing protein [Ditylenchus destructor]
MAVIILFLLISLNILIATSDRVPYFKRWDAVGNLDCSRIIDNDVAYIKEQAKTRVVVNDFDLPTDCKSIRDRHYYPEKPASDEERDFPLAFARNVFRDYILVESELASSYAPQNFYCYALDSKVNETFRKQMHSLASCFPNVYVNEKEFTMDSQGHNQISSLLECMRTLITKDRHWRYVITLQNHDIQVKTNQELVQIFKWMRGANDIEVCHLPDGRVNTSMDWSLAGLGLFRNDTRNYDSDGSSYKLTFAKGYLQSSLSRAFVDFILNELDTSRMLAQLETGACYIDEIFFQTLDGTDALQAPGGYTHACIDQGFAAAYVTRFGVWKGDNPRCHSKFARHSVCIFGMEDLALNLYGSHSLFANKMMPGFDFGAIHCWHEEMHNRTYLRRGVERLNPNMYLQLPQVRYHAERERTKQRNFLNSTKAEFDCRYKVPVQEKLKMYDGQTNERWENHEGPQKKLTGKKEQFKNIHSTNISTCYGYY